MLTQDLAMELKNTSEQVHEHFEDEYRVSSSRSVIQSLLWLMAVIMLQPSHLCLWPICSFLCLHERHISIYLSHNGCLIHI